MGGVSVAASADTIPPAATTGDSGPIGDYTGLGDSGGEASTLTWQLTYAGNGLAHFTVENQISFQGVPVSIERHGYVINEQGERQSRTIELRHLATGHTFTLSGERQ
jgi:hypothetical protein